jgi:hypothetical protein
VAKEYSIQIKYKTPKGDAITASMTFKLTIYDPACNSPAINGANKLKPVQLAQQYYTLGGNQ